MSNGNNANKLIQGCYTPSDPALKSLYKRLVDIFSPVVYFDPAERFFPVDLDSTVKASALYQASGTSYKDEKAQLIKDYGKIVPADLLAADKESFTTVAGWTTKVKKMENQPDINMAVPEIEKIYKKYAQGTIKAKLTVYATVCKLKQVPNYHFFEGNSPTIGTLAEGLLISYYFYFPAMESTEHSREGDWSGISLYFKEVPMLDHLDQRMPLLTCYFRKIADFFDASTDGFRKWQNVTKVKDTSTGLDTHPVVYISQGLHNCYYQPVSTSIPQSPLWSPPPDAEKIEQGKYTSASGDIVGTLEWDNTSLLYIFMPWMLLFEACGATCEFDSPGLGGYPDSDDSVEKGGYGGTPNTAQTGAPAGTTDSYPSKSPAKGSPQFVKLNVIYVDLYDAATKANWGFKGSWGAAEAEWYELTDGDTSQTIVWGCYKGFVRPNLAPWFLWNLFLDSIFGCHGSYAAMP